MKFTGCLQFWQTSTKLSYRVSQFTLKTGLLARSKFGRSTAIDDAGGRAHRRRAAADGRRSIRRGPVCAQFTPWSTPHRACKRGWHLFGFAKTGHRHPRILARAILPPACATNSATVGAVDWVCASARPESTYPEVWTDNTNTVWSLDGPAIWGLGPRDTGLTAALTN
jgi:hypothetical protein